jgi:3-oxoacyl-[acyl-carrier protein] reductase
VVDVSDDDWNKAFQSVFLGAVRMARTATAALGDGGSVALVLSRSVKEPLDDLAISNGLRPGLGMVVKALAREVGPRGVRVNGLLPGAVDTERMQQLHASAADPVAARRAAEEGIPLRRYGRPEEFGRIAAFVLSPAASYLTGAMIPVDGGVTHAL